MDKELQSVFITFEDDIRKMFKLETDRERVRGYLAQVEDESQKKEIISVRKTSFLKKKLTKWNLLLTYGIHWKHIYPLRLARNILISSFYKLLGIKKYVFRGIEFAITFKCNFHCTHCLCSRIDETATREELQPEDYKRIVKEAMKLGGTTFGLEGGEPFVNNKWAEIIEAFMPHKNHVIISTNGFLFDEEKAKLCSKLKVDTINFSMDQGVPELHDLFRRRKGSFDKVINAIQLCRKYNILPLINTVIHKGNLYTRGLITLLEFAENNKIMINCLFAKGVGEFKDKDSMLDDEDFLAFEKIIQPYGYAHIHHQGSLNYNYGDSGCPGVKEMFNLTPYGDVMNCANMHIYFGNVQDESLKSIRDRVLKDGFFNKYRACYLTQDKNFMKLYYPQLEKKINTTLEEMKEIEKQAHQKQKI